MNGGIADGQPGGAVAAALRLAAQHHRAGQLDFAAKVYRRILETAPLEATTLLLLGTVLLQQGRAASAIPALRRATLLRPADSETLDRLGSAVLNGGAPAVAARILGRAVACDAERVAAAHNLGLALIEAGRPREAVAVLARAVRQAPDRAELLIRLAAARIECGEAVEAAAPLRRALVLEPDQGVAIFQHTLTDPDLPLAAVEAQLRRALAAAPDTVPALGNLAELLRETDRPEAAIAAGRRAALLRPERPRVWAVLSAALQGADRAMEAVRAAVRSTVIGPDLADARANHALSLLRLDRPEAAIAPARAAVLLRPESGDIRFVLAQALLAAGDLERGWPAWEDRRLLRGHVHGLGLPPAWRGDGDGRPRLLVTAEQGVGDEVMFASCLPDLRGKVELLAVECDARLIPLYVRSFRGVVLVPREIRSEPGRRVADYGDVLARLGLERHVLLGSLPVLFRRRLADFPPSSRYLVADSVRRAAWRKWLAEEGEGPWIGICWRSRLASAQRASLYSRLGRDWEPLLTRPGLGFVSLQYDDCDDELAAAERRFGVRIRRPPGLDQMNDLDGVAALIDALDAVVTAETAVNCLAGGLGTATFCLAPFRDWQCLGRAGLPWFPATRYYVRGATRSWRELLAAVADDLCRAALPGAPRSATLASSRPTL